MENTIVRQVAFIWLGEVFSMPLPSWATSAYLDQPQLISTSLNQPQLPSRSERTKNERESPRGGKACVYHGITGSYFHINNVHFVFTKSLPVSVRFDTIITIGITFSCFLFIWICCPLTHSFPFTVVIVNMHCFVVLLRLWSRFMFVFLFHVCILVSCSYFRFIFMLSVNVDVIL